VRTRHLTSRTASVDRRKSMGQPKSKVCGLLVRSRAKQGGVRCLTHCAPCAAFFGGASLTPALTGLPVTAGRTAPANAMTSLEMMRHGNVSLSLRFLIPVGAVGRSGFREPTLRGGSNMGK